MTTLYGIKNCDTMKKAMKWLNDNDINYRFHDYRKDGLSLEWLQCAEAALTWHALLNKRGTTFRQLSDEQKANLCRETALELMLAHPAMIKRPVLVADERWQLGFKADEYQAFFA